ncbi:DNA polymerase epsilon subunit 2-like [Daphnia pulex]|uniref:DNA polymerase epsilon subunit 2-like n=1 Tax=Daphnia pulex TaxID=6669 RepID=UPI001EDE6F58|nr:DNA polymerase epsilon subunit 2-like [Daphnia pulex]XP_046654069.1 DNA polymerase epsilon subunit 2-like [Daphnia pulicaria]
MNSRFKNDIVMTFKLNGLTVRSEATKYIIGLLTPLHKDEQVQWLEKLIDVIQKQGLLNSTTVEKSHVERAAKECCQNEFDETTVLLNVISAFDVPKFVYNTERKKYLSFDAPHSINLFGDPRDKSEMFRHRYAILHQRTSRHSLFTPSVLGSGSTASQNKYQLQPIEYLLGMSTKLTNLVVLGMLTYLTEGKLHLEDMTGSVPISLKDTNFHGGLFTENCFVLGQGYFQDGVFHIEHLGMPPPEPAKITRTYFGNTNFFGGSSTSTLKVSVKLKAIEEQNPDAMMVFLSDVWLDQTRVMEKLRILFAGYCEDPPICFVLMGNFLSGTTCNTSSGHLRQLFKSLAEMIKEFPNLVEQTRFIFVPGPSDSGFCNILPRPPLAEVIRAEFVQRIPSGIFTTNPCRIQYGTKEIVVLREDILTKMCRNAINFPSDDIPQQFAKTLTSQGHLCPLPGEICPVYWPYDHALYLYPLPDVVVVGDRLGGFTAQNMDCVIFNPGPFSRNNFNFKVYIPIRSQVEDSEIGDT